VQNGFYSAAAAYWLSICLFVHSCQTALVACSCFLPLKCSFGVITAPKRRKTERKKFGQKYGAKYGAKRV
jgi:hypothetical protein